VKKLKVLINKQTSRQNANSAFKPTDLVTQAQDTVRKTTKVSMSADFQKLSIGSTLTPKAIQFGSPSSVGSTSRALTGSGDEWTKLLNNATSSSIGSLIGGGFLESGINSLISGITDLFDGGGKSESPLVRFALPDSQQKTMHVSSEGLSSSAGNIASPQNNDKGQAYKDVQQGPLYGQSQIVQAVKNALLTSSTLNDIIAEI
jgi:hypothetical protein